MAKVNGTFYTAERLRRGTSPISPPYLGEDGQPYPVNPPGSGNAPLTPPVAKTYASEAAMIADQASQLQGYLYFDGTSNWWYKGTVVGDITDYQAFGSGSGSAPVAATYANQAAMIAAQGSQVANYFYFDSVRYWEYLGTTAGTIADYRKAVFGVSPYDLAQEGATDGQVVAWVAANSRFEPVTIGTIAGSIASTQIAFGSGANTIAGASDFLWNNTTKRMTIGTSSTSPFGDAKLFMGEDQNAETNFQISNSTNGTSAIAGFRIFGANNASSLVAEYSSAHTSTELAGKLCFDANAAAVAHGIAFVLRSSVVGSTMTFYTGGITAANKKITLFNNGNLLLQSGGTHTDGGFKLDVNGTCRIGGNLTFSDAVNISLNATTGTKIGTANTQKLAFWNKTPIIQPTTAITGATLAGGGGTTITDTHTFGGYTLQQLAAALINTGLIA